MQAVADDHQSKSSEEPGTSAEPCRLSFAHYSFDFCERVHCPHDGSQPKKYCDIFGVVTDALYKMDMFLLKGFLGKHLNANNKRLKANTVVSLLHFFFENYGLKEEMCHLHADNCRGQNKNNVVLWYLMWRVMEGRHKSITLSFLLAGHTKFGPDLCFDLFKQHYHKACRTGRVKDIEEETMAASTSGMLIPHLVTEQDGNSGVNFEDWKTRLGKMFKRLKGLDMYHHFEFKMNRNEPEIHHRETVNGTAYIFLPLRVHTKKPPLDSHAMEQAVKKATSEAAAKLFQQSSSSEQGHSSPPVSNTTPQTSSSSTTPSQKAGNQPAGSSSLLSREEQDLSIPLESPISLQPSGSKSLSSMKRYDQSRQLPSTGLIPSSGSSPSGFRREQGHSSASLPYTTPQTSSSSTTPSQQVRNQAVKRKWQDDGEYGLKECEKEKSEKAKKKRTRKSHSR